MELLKISVARSLDVTVVSGCVGTENPVGFVLMLNCGFPLILIPLIEQSTLFPFMKNSQSFVDSYIDVIDEVVI